MHNPFDIPFDTLTIEPTDTGPTPQAQAPTGKATYLVDTRSGRDRRVRDTDRRQEYRLTPDRRSGKDRRPRRSWEPGSNL
jgi:hypothetical protein